MKFYNEFTQEMYDNKEPPLRGTLVRGDLHNMEFISVDISSNQYILRNSEGTLVRFHPDRVRPPISELDKMRVSFEEDLISYTESGLSLAEYMYELGWRKTHE